MALTPCEHCGATLPADHQTRSGQSQCPHCGNARALDASPGTQPAAALEAPFGLDQFMLRGPELISKRIAILDAAGQEIAQFVRPKLPLRGCLTVLCAPGAFLVILVASTSMIMLANHDQTPRLVSGVLGAVGVVGIVVTFLSPWLIVQLMYPYHWLVLHHPSDRHRRLLEVRQGWPLYVTTARYAVRGPANELLGVVRRNVIFNRYDVLDPKGRLLLRMSGEDPGASAAGFGINVVVAILLNALAAALFRAVAVPSLVHDGRRFYIWRCDTSGSQLTECIGTFNRVNKPPDTVRVDVRGTSHGAVDRRLLFALGVAQRFA